MVSILDSTQENKWSLVTETETKDEKFEVKTGGESVVFNSILDALECYGMKVDSDWDHTFYSETLGCWFLYRDTWGNFRDAIIAHPGHHDLCMKQYPGLQIRVCDRPQTTEEKIKEIFRESAAAAAAAPMKREELEPEDIAEQKERQDLNDSVKKKMRAVFDVKELQLTEEEQLEREAEELKEQLAKKRVQIAAAKKDAEIKLVRDGAEARSIAVKIVEASGKRPKEEKKKKDPPVYKDVMIDGKTVKIMEITDVEGRKIPLETLDERREVFVGSDVPLTMYYHSESVNEMINTCSDLDISAAIAISLRHTVKLGYDKKCDTFYSWNNNQKLWTLKNASEFITLIQRRWLPNVFERFSKELRVARETATNSSQVGLQDMLRRNLDVVRKAMGRKATMVRIMALTVPLFSLADPTYSFEKSLNRTPHMHPCRGGKAINTRTLEVRERNIDDHYTYEANGTFIGEEEMMNNKLYRSFIGPMFLNDPIIERHNQRLLGAGLTNANLNKWLVLCQGDGFNGKTSLFNLTKGVLGKKFVKMLPAYSIASSKKGGATPEGQGPQAFIANLNGAAYIIVPEMPANVWLDESFLQNISGGDDITTRGLQQNPFDMESRAIIYITGNSLDALKLSDVKALWARIQCMMFYASFTAENESQVGGNRFMPTLEFKDGHVIDEAFGDAHFTWLCLGAKRSYDNAPMPEKIQGFYDMIKDSAAKRNPAVAFACRYEYDEQARIKGKDLYDSYCAYCAPRGYTPGNSTTFGNTVKRYFESQGLSEEKLKHKVQTVDYHLKLKSTEPNDDIPQGPAPVLGLPASFHYPTVAPSKDELDKKRLAIINIFQVQHSLPLVTMTQMKNIITEKDT